MSRMERYQMHLPVETIDQIRRHATERRVSAATVVREALDAYLGQEFEPETAEPVSFTRRLMGER